MISKLPSASKVISLPGIYVTGIFPFSVSSISLDIADAVMLNAETESAIIAVRMRATVLVSFFHENPSFLFRMLIKIVPR